MKTSQQIRQEFIEFFTQQHGHTFVPSSPVVPQDDPTLLFTNVWNLDPTRLQVSCFEGDEKNGVPRDTESANIWKEVAGLPDDHIHYFGKDNFWEMGETGPCGPCTEIYIDRTPDKSGGKH